MHKFVCVLMIVSSSLHAGKIDSFLEEANSFYKGLEQRKLLLRHQVMSVVEDVNRKKSNGSKIKEIKRSTKLFKFISDNTKNYRMAPESKSYVKSKSSALARMATNIDVKDIREARPQTVAKEVKKEIRPIEKKVVTQEAKTATVVVKKEKSPIEKKVVTQEAKPANVVVKEETRPIEKKAVTQEEKPTPMKVKETPAPEELEVKSPSSVEKPSEEMVDSTNSIQAATKVMKEHIKALPKNKLAEKKNLPFKIMNAAKSEPGKKTTEVSMSTEFKLNYLLILLFIGVGGSMFGALFRLNKRKADRKNEDAYLRLSKLKRSNIPAILVDAEERIFWGNKMAKKLLLTNGSSFFFNREVDVDPVSGETYFKDDHGTVRLVEKDRFEMNGNVYDLILMLSPLKSIPNKSFRVVDGSEPIGKPMIDAFKKHNYLFSNSSIPVSMDQKTPSLSCDARENNAIERVVYLSYLMAKDGVNPRVDIICDSNSSKNSIQLNIRGVKGSEVSFEDEVITEEGTRMKFSEIWNELELSLSSKDGRIFIYDNEKFETPTLTILLTYRTAQEESTQEGATMSI